MILIIVLVMGALFVSLSKVERERKETNVDFLDSSRVSLVVSENVEYYGGFRGYLSRPKAEGVYPGVVMIHEWWGLNDNIRQMADNLASQGYIVLAVDLYGEVTNDSSRARELSSNVRQNPEQAMDNLNGAVEYLKEQNADGMASLGWCFGGGQSLSISLRNEDIDATVIYYGNLVTDEENLSSLDSPVLGIFGSEDSSIPVDSVELFDSSLDSLGIENEIYIYPGVGHAFANPSGMNYAPDETKDAWDKTLRFLEKHMKN